MYLRSDTMKSRIYIKWLEAYLDCKVQHGAMITGGQIHEILMKQYPAMTPSKSSLGKYLYMYLPDLVPTVERPRCFDTQIYRNDMGKHYPCEFIRVRKDGRMWFETEDGYKYELER